MAIEEDISKYWNEDAATYDLTSRHAPTSSMVLAAWRAALESMLPPAPARVLDCGAGTGFLSLLAAQLGHRVTAIDVSSAMLARLDEKANSLGLHVEVSLAQAVSPPSDGYDVVMERHLLWTLPDPTDALRAWRAASAPGATLLLIESVWGDADPVERWLGQARQALGRIRRARSEHHAEYSDELRAALPLAEGTHPERLATLVEECGWGPARLRRLRDVEWAECLDLPFPDRLLGVPARFVVSAGSAHTREPGTHRTRATGTRRTTPASKAQAGRGSRGPRRESTRSTTPRAPDAGPK